MISQKIFSGISQMLCVVSVMRWNSLDLRNVRSDSLKAVIGMVDKGYAIRISPNGTVSKVPTFGGYEEIQRLVGGFFEVAMMYEKAGFAMMVDEEGKLKGKPCNLLATAFYNNPYDWIVGDAILMKLVRTGEYNELDTVPFASEEADWLIGLLTLEADMVD